MLNRFWFTLFFVSFVSNAEYAAQIINPNDGFFVSFGGNASIASTPITASDGSKYYQVGKTISLSGEDATGVVECGAFVWGNPKVGTPPAWHRIFIYQPSANITIDGLTAYRVNSNIVFTIYGGGVGKWWKNGSSEMAACYPASQRASISIFQQQFPIYLNLYIKDKIADNNIMIPPIDLAGYVRAFTGGPWGKAPPFESWDFNKTTAPIRLRPSNLIIPSKCSVSINGIGINKLDLNHGIMSSKNYYSESKSTLDYKCNFSALTKVKFRLDYIQDDDPLKRVPMTNINNVDDKIYSELSLIDNQTGVVGKEIHANIKENYSISVRSILQGNDAVAGNYSGQAWLIATYD